MRLYLSHRITSPTPEGQELNCLAAIAFAKGLRYYFPGVEIYVPAESEPFVAKTYKLGMLTVNQILEIDCQIILKDCEGAIFYSPDGELSPGMRVEYNFCQLEHVPFIIVNSLALAQISQFLTRLDAERE